LYHFLNGDYNGNDLTGWLKTKNSDGTPFPPDCNWNLCRGYQYEPDKVPPAPYQIYHASTTVHIEYFFLAKHPGRANISVVDTATATIIETLKSWDGKELHGQGLLAYGELRTIDGAPDWQTKIDMVMPDLKGRCSVPGECVIQHWWWGDLSPQIDQVFQSCIDFIQPDPNDYAQHLNQHVLQPPVPSSSEIAQYSAKFIGVARDIEGCH